MTILNQNFQVYWMWPVHTLQPGSLSLQKLFKHTSRTNWYVLTIVLKTNYISVSPASALRCWTGNTTLLKAPSLDVHDSASIPAAWASGPVIQGCSMFPLILIQDSNIISNSLQGLTNNCCATLHDCHTYAQNRLLGPLVSGLVCFYSVVMFYTLRRTSQESDTRSDIISFSCPLNLGLHHL